MSGNCFDLSNPTNLNHCLDSVQGYFQPRVLTSLQQSVGHLTWNIEQYTKNLGLTFNYCLDVSYQEMGNHVFFKDYFSYCQQALNGEGPECISELSVNAIT